MSDTTLKTKGSFTGLESLAAGLGDPAFEAGAAELRGMIGNSAEDWSSSLQAALTEDQSLALNLKLTWSQIYGEMNVWPVFLQRAYHSIEAGVGLTNFGDHLTAALQGLQLEEATMPAFDAATNVLDRFWISRLQPALGEDNWRGLKSANPEFSLIPDPAARAGLSFFSNPWNIVVPIGVGGLFGRAATAGVMNAGRMAGLVPEAASSLGTIIGLGAESAGFVATSRVIANVIPPFPPLEKGGEGGFDNDIATEIASSAGVFGVLRLFGWTGRLAQELLPASEMGVSIAKLIGHLSSVLGLATVEEIEPAVLAKFIGQDSPINDETTFYESLWRALFLHTAISMTNNFVSLNGVESGYHEIDARASQFQGLTQEFMQRLAGNNNVIPVNVILTPSLSRGKDPANRGYSYLLRNGADDKSSPRTGTTEISKIFKPAPEVDALQPTRGDDGINSLKENLRAAMDVPVTGWTYDMLEVTTDSLPRLKTVLNTLVQSRLTPGKNLEDVVVCVAAHGPGDPHAIRILLQLGVTVVARETYDGQLLLRTQKANSDLEGYVSNGRLIFSPFDKEGHPANLKYDVVLWAQPSYSIELLDLPKKLRGDAVTLDIMTENLKDDGVLVVEADVKARDLGTGIDYYVDNFEMDTDNWETLLAQASGTKSYLFPSPHLAGENSRVGIFKHKTTPPTNELPRPAHNSNPAEPPLPNSIFKPDPGFGPRDDMMVILGEFYAVRAAIEMRLKAFAERFISGESPEKVSEDVRQACADGGEIKQLHDKGKGVLDALRQYNIILSSGTLEHALNTPVSDADSCADSIIYR